MDAIAIGGVARQTTIMLTTRITSTTTSTILKMASAKIEIKHILNV